MTREERDMLIVAQERLKISNERYTLLGHAYYRLMMDINENQLSDWDKRLIKRNQEVIDEIQNMLDNSEVSLKAKSEFTMQDFGKWGEPLPADVGLKMD